MRVEISPADLAKAIRRAVANYDMDEADEIADLLSELEDDKKAR